MNQGVTFRRILKSGIVNFFRNGLVSIATVLVMSLSLLMLGSVFIASIFLNTFVANLQDKVDISVSFTKTATEQQILDLKSALSALPAVKRVVYISRDEALRDFTERHKGQELILRSLEVVGENPFPASVEIGATDPSKYEAIAQFIERDAYREIIDKDDQGNQKISYRQNQEVIDRLSSWISAARTVGLAASIILAIIALIVAYNTVRLAIYNSRDEIAVMQLVGASRSFIRGPFLVEGVMHGIIATLVTFAVFYPGLWWIGKKTARMFGGLDVFQYFISNIIQIFLILLVAGVALGVLSSRIAIRRYLKV